MSAGCSYQKCYVATVLETELTERQDRVGDGLSEVVALLCIDPDLLLTRPEHSEHEI
jgi:hypothetical protein